MKNILTLLLISFCLVATAQIQTPQPSPAGSVTSVVGLTEVKISYSRPKAKGRKIFGEGGVVSYGKIWRTGANSGSVITFSDDVKVENNAVPKGSYLIFTWPGAAEWTVALYKDLDLGGDADHYDKAKELCHFTVKPEKLTEKVETLTFAISDLIEDNTSAKIQIAWENTSVKFGITVDYDSKIMKNISSSMMTSARYYYENKKDINTALILVNEYFANGKNADQYWNLLVKAQILKATGDKKGALATSQLSWEVAKKANNEDYMKQNEELQKTLK